MGVYGYVTEIISKYLNSLMHVLLDHCYQHIDSFSLKYPN